ncbi:MAG: hypothetical protein ACJ757_04415 [Gaiellaceae bacterium]
MRSWGDVAYSGVLQGQPRLVRRLPHDAQRAGVRTTSIFFAVPARIISHAAAAAEIAENDCSKVMRITPPLAHRREGG